MKEFDGFNWKNLMGLNEIAYMVKISSRYMESDSSAKLIQYASSLVSG